MRLRRMGMLATIQSEIDGNGQITGLPSLQVAHTLAAVLVYGSLPLSLRVVSAQRVVPAQSTVTG